MNTRPHAGKKVLLLGSGALKIAEAGEFDYSGSQAVKALREEGVEIVLVNPNIATIQTSCVEGMAHIVYFLPVTAYFVERVIEREKPWGILLGFGGQTALNCGLELWKRGVLRRYNVEVLGTPVSAILKTEDRLRFRKTIQQLKFHVPGSILCKSMTDVHRALRTLKFPAIVRAGFSLGGLGSGIVYDREDFLSTAQKALTLSPQILVEEYLEHWKEVEYEVVRDKMGNAVAVCNMENFDPMGIHTGESIVVAPSQTLTNQEYQMLREIAISVVSKLPIIGECNIQYALHPTTGAYRIIEVNARLSRSSALASKATGYPLAYIAAKLALGYTLDEIPNQVTKKTTAFFEPALDYVVVKIPRWDFLKFKDADGALGSEMQSVGEVMGIGRTFEESLQKAIRSLDIDYEGIISDDLDKATVMKKARARFRSLHPTPSRPYNIAYNLFLGQSPPRIHAITGISLWFLERIQTIVSFYRVMLEQSERGPLTPDLLLQAKKLGFSDQQIGEVWGKGWKEIRSLRKSHGIVPRVCQIDTTAAEFPAQTNYLYLSYHRQADDITGSPHTKQVAILGGGPYQIGSSVEFDWCGVMSARTARSVGYSPLIINCNPETVSTDYDVSDKLYFEELTAERVLDILEFESCGVIVSVGGQLPNTLVSHLRNERILFLGNSPTVIDQVEDREKFSRLLDSLAIHQPIWARVKSKREALRFTKKIGFPVLVRPSYVLSGKAMFVAYSREVLESFFHQSTAIINPDYPMVISKFIGGAKEVDFDAVSRNGEMLVWAISEHVEHAGVHSGDATLVLPSFSLSQEAIDLMVASSKKIISALTASGPLNIQYLVHEDGRSVPEVLVIEANLRASRSFPFVSKVLGVNFIDLSTRVMLGFPVEKPVVSRPDWWGVKVPHFSFTRLRQVDPVLRVEMTSTGEVACFGETMHEAYLKALLSTGLLLPKRAALLSLGGDEGKQKFLHSARLLLKLGFRIFATRHTSLFLRAHTIDATVVYKMHEERRPNVVDLIRTRKVDLVVNLSDKSDLGVKELSKQVTDGYLIRRAAVDANIPLFTKSTIANLFVSSLRKYTLDTLQIRPWHEYVSR